MFEQWWQPVALVALLVFAHGLPCADRLQIERGAQRRLSPAGWLVLIIGNLIAISLLLWRSLTADELGHGLWWTGFFAIAFLARVGYEVVRSMPDGRTQEPGGEIESDGRWDDEG
ncbi:MAG: hypothetical protein ACREJ2_18030 [Planctomycetota bacterium]